MSRSAHLVSVSLFFILSIFLVACASESKTPILELSTPTPIPVDGEIQINPSDELQTIEGFGASGAWWAQDVGGWDDGSREQIIKLLFDQQEGIGLSIYRYNIGGGDGESIPDNWRRAETFEVAQGEYDWDRDANAIWVLKAAQEAGVETLCCLCQQPTSAYDSFWQDECGPGSNLQSAPRNVPAVCPISGRCSSTSAGR